MAFLQFKNEFDIHYSKKMTLDHSLIPVDGKYITNILLKNKRGDKNEEYYKWQFIYALTHSGLFSKDYLGAEVYFPKGNKNSAPIKIDTCIFDSHQWIDYYKNWRDKKDDDGVEWLRSHLITTIEFKKSDGSDIKTVFTSQVKPELKEAEGNYCLGINYVTRTALSISKKK
jgi:type I restriction enzyme M protein